MTRFHIHERRTVQVEADSPSDALQKANESGEWLVTDVRVVRVQELEPATHYTEDDPAPDPPPHW